MANCQSGAKWVLLCFGGFEVGNAAAAAPFARLTRCIITTETRPTVSVWWCLSSGGHLCRHYSSISWVSHYSDAHQNPVNPFECCKRVRESVASTEKGVPLVDNFHLSSPHRIIIISPRFSTLAAEQQITLMLVMTPKEWKGERERVSVLLSGQFYASLGLWPYADANLFLSVVSFI